MNTSRYCWCGIYTRQSRDTDSDYSSCKAQFDACWAFVTSRLTEGWVCNGRRYEDEAESSETLERPGLQQLLEHIREGKVDRVVVHRLDRLSRRLVDCIGFLQELHDRQIPLTIVSQPELGTSAEHSLFLNLMASFAELEQEMTRERLADARVALKRRGRRVAGVVPYGYEADPVTKQLIVVPNEAFRVRSMFELAASGKTPTEIADYATGKGWRTKFRMAAKTEKASSGNSWTPRQVLATLSNPVYAGRIQDGDGVRPGVHEPIIDEDLFKAVRREISSRRTRSPGKKVTIDWPLRGLLYCGQCDRVMSPTTSGHRNIRYRYYRCRSNAGGRRPCRSVSIAAEEIEQFVIRALKDSAVASQTLSVSGVDPLLTVSQLLDSSRAIQRKVLSAVLKKVVFDAEKERIGLVFHGEVSGDSPTADQ